MQQTAFGRRSNFLIFRVSDNLRMFGTAAGIALSGAVAAADNVYVKNNGVGPLNPAFLSAAKDAVDHYNVDQLPSPIVSPIPRRLSSRSQRDLTNPGIEGNNENGVRLVTQSNSRSPHHVSSEPKPEPDPRLERMIRQIKEMKGNAEVALKTAAPKRTESNSPSSLDDSSVQLSDFMKQASVLERAHTSMLEEARKTVVEAISEWQAATKEGEAANRNLSKISEQYAAVTHMNNVYVRLLAKAREEKAKAEEARAHIAVARPAPDEDSNVVNTSFPAGSIEASDRHLESAQPAPSGSTSDNQSSHYALHREWLHSLIAEISTTPLRLPSGISIDDTRVSVGAPGSERKIVNVARGTHFTDAVNKGQLDEAVARVDGDASAGIASAMAVAGLPQPTSAGRSIVTASSASYRGRPGMALGISHVTPDNRWVMKLAASANGRGYFGAVAAGGFQW